MGNLALSPVDTLVLGDHLEVFYRFVHEITDIIDLSKNFCVGIPLDKLLQLAIDYSNTLNVARVVVDLLKFRVEPIALFIVAARKFGF